jgi:Lrp/AsnC family transcriptional regulator for asnA, asnC and gidA
MNKIMINLLLEELLKNSKRSDRELAKALGTSQATITRMRNKLEKDGLIQKFTVIPDPEKMGFEIIAITPFKTKLIPEITEKEVKWARTKQNVIFSAKAEGMGKNAVIISIHKNYTEYTNFLNDFLLAGKGAIESYETMLISLKGGAAKNFSLEYLAKQTENKENNKNPTKNQHNRMQ